MTPTLTRIAQSSRPILARYGVTRAALFGSHARGTAHEASDIDVLVSFETPLSLFRFVGLERELSGALGARVDLVTEGGLSPYLRTSILGTMQVFYEK